MQGIGCGSIVTNGRSILRDYFSGRDLASAISYASMGFAIGFGVSPILGAYLGKYFGWRSNFVFLLAIGLVQFFVLSIWLPETSLSLEKNSAVYKFIQKTVIDYKSILHHPVFLQFLLGGIFAYVIVVAYNVTTPFLIQNVLGYSSTAYGYLALLVAVPYYMAASINRRLALKYGAEPVLFGSWLIAIAGILMAITMLSTKSHLSFIIIPMMMATLGQALIFSNSIAMALHQFSVATAGRASALFSGLQIVFTGIFSAILAILPNQNQPSLALVVICPGLLSGFALWKQTHKPA